MMWAARSASPARMAPASAWCASCDLRAASRRPLRPVMAAMLWWVWLAQTVSSSLPRASSVVLPHVSRTASWKWTRASLSSAASSRAAIACASAGQGFLEPVGGCAGGDPLGAHAGRGRFDDGADDEGVLVGHVAELEEDAEVPGEVLDGRLLDDGAAPHPPADLDQPLRLEHPQRFPQRRSGHVEALDQQPLGQEVVARLPVAGDQLPQLVGDDLGGFPVSHPRSKFQMI